MFAVTTLQLLIKVTGVVERPKEPLLIVLLGGLVDLGTTLLIDGVNIELKGILR